MTNDGNSAGVQKRLDLEELVKSATWRELLIELVESNSIDPWDIDIVKIANEYREAVRKMQLRDLRIPANMVLASSILLRMKSDSMEIFPEPPEEAAIEEGVARVNPAVEELVPKLRIQPKRKITLEELMDALGSALKTTETRERESAERAAAPNIVINEHDDIDQKIEAADRLIRSNVGKEGTATYSALSRYFGSESEAIFNLFIPALFLAYRGKIKMGQENFFGEIVLSLCPNEGV
jgi:segregation and condensation protein A